MPTPVIYGGFTVIGASIMSLTGEDVSVKFPCSGCGACCRDVTHLYPILESRPNGSCVHLVDNKCSIYDTRPRVCNVERMYEEYAKPQISQRRFFLENSLACNKLMDKRGIDQKFRIDIEREYPDGDDTDIQKIPDNA